MKNSALATLPVKPKFPRSPKPPKPPASLSRAGRQLWRAIQEQYAIVDPGGLSHLLSACRAEDDINRMREAIAKDGDTVEDRFKQKQSHPLLASIRGTETVKRQALAALNLDIEPLKDRVGRPGGK